MTWGWLLGGPFLDRTTAAGFETLAGWLGPATYLLGTWTWWRRSAPVGPGDVIAGLFRARRGEPDRRVPGGAWVFVPMGAVVFGGGGLLALRAAVYKAWLIPVVYPLGGALAGAVLWQAAVQGYLFFPPASGARVESVSP